MKQFRYKVRNNEGIESSGVLEAVDEKQAVSVLRSKGMLVTAIVSEDQISIEGLLSYFKKPKFEDITNFTRQLSTMITAGLPLIDALRLLRNQATSSLKSIISEVLKEVEGGTSLSDALQMSGGGIFSNVYIALVRAGESAGVLDQVLSKLAINMEKQHEFRSKTRGAMIYPAIILIGMVVIGFVMMVFVVPKLTTMYTDFGVEMPLPTKILMAISGFMAARWYLIIALAIGGGVFVSNWVKTEVGGLIVEQLVFKIPIFGKLKKELILTEFARTMGVLLSSGIPILDALNIVSETLGSRTFATDVVKMASLVEKGLSLEESVQKITVFPPILSQMVAVGEETGKLDEVLEKLAIYYESESELKVKALMTAVEPLIMVVMGLGVGFLVIAVIMPIYNLTSNL